MLFAAFYFTHLDLAAPLADELAHLLRQHLVVDGLLALGALVQIQTFELPPAVLGHGHVVQLVGGIFADELRRSLPRHAGFHVHDLPVVPVGAEVRAGERDRADAPRQVEPIRDRLPGVPGQRIEALIHRMPQEALQRQFLPGGLERGVGHPVRLLHPRLQVLAPQGRIVVHDLGVGVRHVREFLPPCAWVRHHVGQGVLRMIGPEVPVALRREARLIEMCPRLQIQQVDVRASTVAVLPAGVMPVGLNLRDVHRALAGGELALVEAGVREDVGLLPMRRFVIRRRSGFLQLGLTR